MSLAVAILMKDPAQAKTRLSGALEFDAREKLALTLFENTLAFFCDAYGAAAVGVVTPSARIAGIADGAGAEVIHDSGEGGINGAAAQAKDWAKASSADRLLVVHADIPVLDREEFAQLAEAARKHDVVIASSADGGTNALLLTPPDAISFCFGKNSASAHEKAARALGKSSITLQLEHLSQDIDRPADLAAYPDLAELAGSTEQSGEMSAFAVTGLPEVAKGDDIGGLIADAIERQGKALQHGDIVVVAQKIVSKAEGQLKPLNDFAPSERAGEIATKTGKDARKVEAILRESAEVLRMRDAAHGGLIITRHRHGWVCANAGIDESNIGSEGDNILLLPDNPDNSAQRIAFMLADRFGVSVGVVISDTFGRPWRNGLVNIAIGVAGVPALVEWAGKPDAYGRELAVTMPAFADEVAAAAGLLMPKDAGIPVVVVHGLNWVEKPYASARDVLRPVSQELFL